MLLACACHAFMLAANRRPLWPCISASRWPTHLCPEIESPLGDAVRLVHRNERQALHMGGRVQGRLSLHERGGQP